jgi:uncharacterized lipoprotein YddW (UPF0748 family)
MLNQNGGTTSMQRRSFLQLLGAGSLTLGSVVRLLAADGRSARHHWTWTRVRENEPRSDWQRNFAEIRAAGIGSILLMGASSEACSLASAEGLEVHAWTWTLCNGNKDLLANHPQWYVVSREGKSASNQPPYVPYYHFLCPSRPEVRQYLCQEFARKAATPGLAGMHLDYIRYPDVILPRGLWEKYDLVQDEELPPFDFCYCDVCREQFRQQSGKDPLELPDPPADLAWRRFRWESVTRLVNELVEVIHKQNKQATAAVFPSPSIARQLVRQDWPSWNLDAILPMVYHNFYQQNIDWIEPTVREGVKALPDTRPLYAGLYMPALKGDGDFEQAVSAALSGGAAGVALFGGVEKI